MGESPESPALAELTVNVIKTLKQLNEFMLSEPDGRRRAKLRKIITELDALNDEAMRSGLKYDAGHIIQLKTGRRQSRSTGAKQSGPRDPRSVHPGLQAARDLIGRYPHKDVWDLIIRITGEEPNLERMRECWLAWRSKNYSPLNLAWLTDWYVNGIPATQQQLRSTVNSDRSAKNGQDVAAEFRNEVIH